MTDMTDMTEYTFGTYDDIPAGKAFRIIDVAECDSDAQAEHTCRYILDRPEEYDITDVDGKRLKRLRIVRDDAEWSHP